MWITLLITQPNVDKPLDITLNTGIFSQKEQKMFISKKSILITSCVILLCVCFAIITPIAIAETKTIYSAVVVVDAGHGGLDNGVVSKDGLKESEVNLEIAKLLQGKLEKRKIKVVMTRTDENALAIGKKNDMAERKKIIVDNKPICVISIHTNKFVSTSRNGTQVFYDDTKFSQQFAVIMQTYLNENINKKYRARNNYEPIGGDYFITKCVKIPSIIIESGFISNANDCLLLRNPLFKADLADAIADVVETQVFASM